MQILLLLVLTVALYFAVAFAGELIASQRIESQVSALNVDIARLQNDNTRLTSQVAEARSDAFIEHEARDRLGLIRAGDTAVVVVNAPVPAATPTPAPPKPRAHWQNWTIRLGLAS